MSVISQLRSYRFLEMAIFDWVATALGAFLIQRYWLTNVSFLPIFFGFTILGIFIHYLLAIPTMFNYYLGLSEKPQRL